ncbi:proteasome component M29 [Ascosphaera pollenicola]|nr:proteasome component M29 [Ascosphaera pollenicola]
MAEKEDPTERELRLVNAVEMRIALADTDEKLQELLKKYLPPLLLKLASKSLDVRQKVISICQHINTRLRPLTRFRLPVRALLQQFKEEKNTLVRNFDLTYLKLGLERIEQKKQAQLVPELIEGVGSLESPKQAASVFHIILKLLPYFRIPQPGTPEHAKLRETLQLKDEDAAFLAKWFTKILLMSPTHIESDEHSHPSLSKDEFEFLNNYGDYNEVWKPPHGLNFLTTKVVAAQWLSSGAFRDPERFVGCVVLLADQNLNAMPSVGNYLLRRAHFDLEDEKMIDDLYALYLGRASENPIAPALPHIQIKILEFLSRSVIATTKADQIKEMMNLSLTYEMPRDPQQIGLEAVKLRNHLFSFIIWIARVGDPAALQKLIPMAITAIQDFILKQGWPNAHELGVRVSGGDTQGRALIYETLGLLTAKKDRSQPTNKLLKTDYALLEWLLVSYCCDASSQDISVSIDQALGSFLNSFSKMINGDYDAKIDILITTFQATLSNSFTLYMLLEEGDREPTYNHVVVRNARYITLRFINRCMPFSNVPARWLNLIGLGKANLGERPEVIEEAQKGLDPYWYAMTNNLISSTTKAEQLSFPPFSELAAYLFAKQDEKQPLLSIPFRFSKLSTQPKTIFGSSRGIAHAASLAPAITFCRNILLCEAFSAAGIKVEGEADWEKFLDVKLTADEHNRAIVRKFINEGERAELVGSFLAAALSGLLYTEPETNRTFNPAQCGQHFIELASLASNDLLAPLAQAADPAFFESSIYSNDLAVQDLTCRAFSIIASHPDFSDEKRAEFISMNASLASSWNNATGATLNRVRGALLVSVDTMSRVYLRHNSQTLPGEVVKKLIELIFDIICNARDASLKDVAHKALGQLSLATAIKPDMFPQGDEDEEVGSKIIAALTKSAKKEDESAIFSLSCLTAVFGPDSSVTKDIHERLYSLHEIRKPEVQFTVGEGLSIIALGCKSQALIAKFDVDAELPAPEISEESISDMLHKVIAGCKEPKPSLRKASAIWLLCLIRFCSRSESIRHKLRNCQTAFIRLLSDRDELVQETACRGLSLVYDKGSQHMRDELIRDLVRSFTAERDTQSNVFGGGQVTEETEIFNPGAIPTGDGSSVTTYKDIVNLASEAGDPSLVYRFMSLASSNAIWSSRVAFGQFGLSGLFSDSAVSGHLAQNPKIYAKLFRYRFDPNPNVQRSMNDIWNVIVKDSNAVINEHCDLIMRDLLDTVLDGREWRGRQASCLAIADLLQGRQLDQYEAYLDEILTKAFRLIDDIKGSVREAATKLCAVLTKIVLRMLESGDASENERPRKMLDIIVPFLLGDKGMLSGVKEVVSFSTATMIGIIKHCPPKVLQPHIPAVLEAFMNSLSTSEGGVFNFVHLNADKYGLKGEEIDKMRLDMLQQSPLMESINVHLLDALDTSDGETMTAVTKRLEDILRTAISLPTKVAVAQFIVLLSSRPLIFEPYADRFMKLMRKHLMDRNTTASAAYSSCLGYLTRLASGNQILATINFAQSLYFDTDTNEVSTTRRMIAGEIILAMTKAASDQMSRFNTAFLPFVFIAKHDRHVPVRVFFHVVWEQNVSGTRAISSLYFAENLQLITKHLDSPQWMIKQASSFAVKETVYALISETTDEIIDTDKARKLWPVLEKAIGGRTWEGKEQVLDAYVKFCLKASDLWKTDADIRKKMLTIMLREAKRNKAYYRPHALRALGEFSRGRSDVHTLKDAVAIVEKAVEDVTDKNQMDGDDGDEVDAKTEEFTLSAGVECVLGCVTPDVDDEQTISSAIEVINRAVQHSTRDALSALYESLQRLFRDTPDESKKAQKSAITGKTGDNIKALAKALLFRDHTHAGMAFEATRLTRAEAAEAFFDLLADNEKEEFLKDIERWLGEERSTSVQKALPRRAQLYFKFGDLTSSPPPNTMQVIRLQYTLVSLYKYLCNLFIYFSSKTWQPETKVHDWSNMKPFTPFSSLSLLLLTLYLCGYLGPSICRALPASGARQTGLSTPKEHQPDSPFCQDDPECLSRLFERLEELSRIADIAYCVPAPGIHKPFQCTGRCREFQGFELIKTWNTGPMLSDSTGYLALSHLPRQKRIILAFRGTYSLANVVADLSVAPQVYTPSIEGGDGEEFRCENCTVHGGFLRSWLHGRDAVIKDLERAIHNFPSYQFIVVGHSLGGAVATLAGLEFLLRGWNPHVVTFGQPRVGNLRFSEFVDESFRLGMHGQYDEAASLKSPSFHRVTHINDPIPLLPLSEWGYVPHSGEVYIERDELPATASDLRLCVGRNDTGCSAGQEFKRQEAADGEDDGSAELPTGQEDGAQAPMMEELSEQTNQTPMVKGIFTIPARFRIWELFVAHRDYFHRLGICRPHTTDGL